VFVLMNADGSPGVYVRARIGASFPALGGIGGGVLTAVCSPPSSLCS